MADIHAIFVYGTLQRGEERARFWPRSPVEVLAARVQGTLYDLGPYPALVPGEDWVRGELWLLRPEDVAETLRALDEVEGFGQPGQADLYTRATIRCTFAGGTRDAFVYYFARPAEIASYPQVTPGRDGVRHWPTGRCLHRGGQP